MSDMIFIFVFLVTFPTCSIVSSYSHRTDAIHQSLNLTLSSFSFSNNCAHFIVLMTFVNPWRHHISFFYHIFFAAIGQNIASCVPNFFHKTRLMFHYMILYFTMYDSFIYFFELYRTLVSINSHIYGTYNK